MILTCGGTESCLYLENVDSLTFHCNMVFVGFPFKTITRFQTADIWLDNRRIMMNLQHNLLIHTSSSTQLTYSDWQCLKRHFKPWSKAPQEHCSGMYWIEIFWSVDQRLKHQASTTSNDTFFYDFLHITLRHLPLFYGIWYHSLDVDTCHCKFYKSTFKTPR